jgi:hypothetical protein
MSYPLNKTASVHNIPASHQPPPLKVTTDANPITEIAADRFPTSTPSAPPLKVTINTIFERIASVVGALKSPHSISDIKKEAHKNKLELVKVKPEDIKPGNIILVQRDQGAYCEVFEATSKGTTVEYAAARPNSSLREKTDNTVRLRGGIATPNGLSQRIVESIDTKTGTEYWLVRNKKIVPKSLSSFHFITSILSRIFRF